jgi:hypothetical protein
MIESLMPKPWRVFQAGVLCGIILMAAAVLIWPITLRSPEDKTEYDFCIATGGSVRNCALMVSANRKKALEANETFEKAMKEEVARRLSSGASKREVVQWAKQNGFVDKALSDAVGISLKDIEDDNY